MARKILINTIDEEESRMAIIEDGKLVEFNIQMSVKEPTTGNIYKGIVQRVERGLQAAFVEYGGNRNGFLPLNDVRSEYFVRAEEGENTGKPEGKPVLKVGQELLVQVVREQKNNKGAMLTTYLSLPGRYIVLMPGKRSSGISRKIENEADRKRLRDMMDTIVHKEGMGFIVRTAGMNRTKQELLRDFQILLRLWKDIKQKAEKTSAPALIYQESDFAVRSLRDYYTSDVDEILVDSVDTYKKMRTYFKAVSPRNVKMIKQYKEDTPIFNKYNLENQIDAVYRERVNLKSGSYLIITPTEAMITIDVNSGRATNRKDVEETAFRTNLAAAEEIARQLRLRDLGGLIVIDFIDMKDQKHNAQVEKVFKKSLKVDRLRIQLSKISKFGILELSRQKKQSTIQEISYTSCPHCKGTGMRPSMEYIALNTFRKIKSEAVKGDYSAINVSLPYEVSDYLLNQKRSEMSKIESLYDISIHVSGSRDVLWGECSIEMTKRAAKVEEVSSGQETEPVGPISAVPESEGKAQQKTPYKGRRPQRRRRRRPAPQVGEQVKEANESIHEEKQVLSNDVSHTTEAKASSESEPETMKEKKKWKVGFFDLFKP